MSEVVTALLALTAIISSGMAVHFHHRLMDAEKRIGQLELAQAKHLPYRAADEIENSLAALLRLKNEADFRQDLIDNALNHLQQARNGKK